MAINDMTALVGSIQKFSVEDGPGIRTTVFLKGCPLNCRWCHNPEMINPQQQLIKSPNNCIGCGSCVKACPQGAISMSPSEGIVIDRLECKVCLRCADECFARALRPVAEEMTADEIMSAVEQDRDFYENTGGGMTISGGEVLMHADFALELVGKAERLGIGVCIDTCGYGDSHALMKLASAPNVTGILFDMKSVDDHVHLKYTGTGNQLIMSNLEMLASDDEIRDKITMRMPLIKGINDGEEIIRETGELYSRLGLGKVSLLPYHSFGIGKMRNIGGVQEEFERPSDSRLAEIEAYFAEELGMSVEILGES